MSRDRVFLPPVLLILLGCSASTEPEWSRVPGLVVEGTAPFTSVVAPAEVARGQTFEITVSTFGSSSCTRSDGYELSLTAAGAEIRVFDRVAPQNTPCTDDFRQFPRTVALSFPAAGTIELTVVGRGFDEQPLTVRAIVLVR